MLDHMETRLCLCSFLHHVEMTWSQYKSCSGFKTSVTLAGLLPSIKSSAYVIDGNHWSNYGMRSLGFLPFSDAFLDCFKSHLRLHTIESRNQETNSSPKLQLSSIEKHLPESTMKASSTETNRQTRKPNVRFNLNASKTLLIPSHKMFSAEEVDNYWCSKEDYQRIWAQTKVIERMMKLGHFDKEDDNRDCCFRGIQSNETKQRRAKYRQQAMESLYWEQKRQYMSGVTNEENLRAVLVICTRLAVDEAIARAHYDELETLGKTLKAPTCNIVTSKATLSSSLALSRNLDFVAPLQAPVTTKSELVSLLNDVLSLVDEPILT